MSNCFELDIDFERERKEPYVLYKYMVYISTKLPVKSIAYLKNMLYSVLHKRVCWVLISFQIRC